LIISVVLHIVVYSPATLRQELRQVVLGACRTAQSGGSVSGGGQAALPGWRANL